MTDLRKAAEMALKFCEDIGELSGPYPYVNGTGIVYDSRQVAKALRDRLAQPEPNYKAIFDLLFEANSADIEALTDAQFTLEAIKSADPGTYDEIIDASLRLIKVALNNSVVGPLEVIADKMGVET